MDTQSDYVMRLISTCIRALAAWAKGEQFSYYQQALGLSPTDSSLFFRLMALVKNGRIEEAENVLWTDFDGGFGDDWLFSALDFYDYLNTLTDDQLESCHFSRAEIGDGLRAVASRNGCEALVNELLREEIS